MCGNTVGINRWAFASSPAEIDDRTDGCTDRDNQPDEARHNSKVRSRSTNPLIRAVCEQLFFPDGHFRLYLFNEISADGEGNISMRRSDATHDGDISYLQIPDPVFDSQSQDSRSFCMLAENLVQAICGARMG